MSGTASQNASQSIQIDTCGFCCSTSETVDHWSKSPDGNSTGVDPALVSRYINALQRGVMLSE